jgi:hypothetical protein
MDLFPERFYGLTVPGMNDLNSPAGVWVAWEEHGNIKDYATHVKIFQNEFDAIIEALDNTPGGLKPGDRSNPQHLRKLRQRLDVLEDAGGYQRASFVAFGAPIVNPRSSIQGSA